jgi:hypothetical protein
MAMSVSDAGARTCSPRKRARKMGEELPRPHNSAKGSALHPHILRRGCALFCNRIVLAQRHTSVSSRLRCNRSELSSHLAPPPESSFSPPSVLLLSVLAATGIGFHLFLTGALKAGSTRYNIVNDAFWDRVKKTPAGQQLLEDHKRATGAPSIDEAEKSLKGGYPDVGNGRIAAFFTYDEWYRFNAGQRAHYNYLEMAGPAVAALLIGGLHAPTLAAAAGLGVIVGREAYAQGYTSKRGAPARSTGALVSGLSFLTLIGTAVYSSLKVAQVL